MPREELQVAVKRGWHAPVGSSLAHYFVSGVSLCFRWTYAGELVARAPVDAVEGDDCIACTRRLASHRAPDGAQETPGGAVLPPGPISERGPAGG